MVDQAQRRQEEDGGARPAAFLHPVDCVVAGLIVAGCAFLFWETTNFAQIPRGLAQNVPPALFPRLLLVVIAAMALLLPFEHIQKRAQPVNLDDARRDRIQPITYLTALALTAVVLVMPWLGTLPAMILACGVLPILWGERRWWLVAIYALALPVAVTLLFVGGLEVRFIQGVTGPLLR